MKIRFSLLSLLFLISFCSKSQNAVPKKKYKINKTNSEWKNQLTAMQYYVLREAGTEVAFSSSYDKNYTKGVYVCAACKTELYSSKDKFDSGSGWPSFDRAIKNNVALDIDYDIGYGRTEVKCHACGGHLGHSINDVPKKTTGKIDCINGVAFKFIPSKK